MFAAYSDAVRPQLLGLRALILDEAAATEGVGDLEESLKWGQPSYRPRKPKTGTTLRIDEITGTPAHYGLFVHCQTSLIAIYRELYAGTLTFDGERCVLFDADDVLPEEAVRHCVRLALTYHRDKRRDRLPI